MNVVIESLQCNGYLLFRIGIQKKKLSCSVGASDKVIITVMICHWAVSFLSFNQPLSTVSLPSAYLAPVGIEPLTFCMHLCLCLLTEVNNIEAVKCQLLWKGESEKKTRGPSVVLYNTIWPLISADTKADGGIASLVAIPVPDHQWIPTVILSFPLFKY